MIRDVGALRDDQGERLRDLAPGGRARQRGPRCDDASSTRCCGWPVRAAAGAICLSASATVKRRYYRWIERGALDGSLEALAAEADLEWLMIDSTIVGAHRHAAGARIAKGADAHKAVAAPAAA